MIDRLAEVGRRAAGLSSATVMLGVTGFPPPGVIWLPVRVTDGTTAHYLQVSGVETYCRRATTGLQPGEGGSEPLCHDCERQLRTVPFFQLAYWLELEARRVSEDDMRRLRAVAAAAGDFAEAQDADPAVVTWLRRLATPQAPAER